MFFPICDFASSQHFHQVHNSPVFVCFRSIYLIFLAINSTVIAAVSSLGVNCSSRLKMLSEYICLKKSAIVASVRTAWRASVLREFIGIHVLSQWSVTRRSECKVFLERTIGL